MVETFKYLNYFQLAASSFASKRFCTLIRTHRNKLALLDVNDICINSYVSNHDPVVIKMFNEELSPEEYNKFIVRNGYSKQIPLDDQNVGMESGENCCDIYKMTADVYQSPNHCHNIATNVFYAHVELKDETWPLFQHFIRLLTDPFIYIRTLELNFQKDVLSFLAGALNSERNRLHCKQLFHYNIRCTDDTQKLIVWIKDHVRCDEIKIYDNNDLDNDEELLDLLLNGAPCTSTINVVNYVPLKTIVSLVQKFANLKNHDEYHVVESIRGYIEDQSVVNELKRNCAELIAEGEQYEECRGTRQIIGFINNDIKKKLTLSVGNFSSVAMSSFSIKITNL